jgi:hypothetical protein
MSNTVINSNPRPITVAELCEAIYSGKLNVAANDDYYMVKMRDLVQLSRMVSSPQPPLHRRLTRPLALAS